MSSEFANHDNADRSCILAGRMQAIEIVRARDWQIIEEMRGDIKALLDNVQQINLSLARNRGGWQAGLLIASLLASLSGWAMWLRTHL